MFVQYEQTARPYALVIALVIWSSYFFVGELERPSRSGATGYVVTSALAIYAHYFAVLVLLVQLATLVLVKRQIGVERRWLAIGGWIAVLCFPEVIAGYRKGAGGLNWIAHPTLGDLTHMPLTLTGGGVLSFCLLSLGLYGVVKPPSTIRGWRIWFPAGWFLAPLLLDFAFSALIKPSFPIT